MEYGNYNIHYLDDQPDPIVKQICSELDNQSLGRLITGGNRRIKRICGEILEEKRRQKLISQLPISINVGISEDGTELSDPIVILGHFDPDYEVEDQITPPWTEEQYFDAHGFNDDYPYVASFFAENFDDLAQLLYDNEYVQVELYVPEELFSEELGDAEIVSVSDGTKTILLNTLEPTHTIDQAPVYKAAYRHPQDYSRLIQLQ